MTCFQTELFSLDNCGSVLTLEVPQPPPLQVAPGDTITTCSGPATVTEVAIAGQAQLIFADYGSGIPQPHIPEGIDSISSPPEHSPSPSSGRTRRHTPKGDASGWIEERMGNKSRKTPTLSYYYCWDDAAGRHRKYIPARKLWRVQQLWDMRRSVDEILEYLTGPRG